MDKFARLTAPSPSVPRSMRMKLHSASTAISLGCYLAFTGAVVSSARVVASSTDHDGIRAKSNNSYLRVKDRDPDHEEQHRALGTNKTLAPTTSVVVQSETPSMMPSHEPTEEPTTSPVTSAPTPCGNRLFYIITIDGVTKCSNGYDKNADRPDFFETVEDCCSFLVAESILDADEDCKYVDVCNPTDEPTVSPTADPITPAPAPKPIPVSLYSVYFSFFIHQQLISRWLSLLRMVARTHHRYGGANRGPYTCSCHA